MADTVRKIIYTGSAPKAVGPYSQAVVVDRTMFISGQVGYEPSTMEIVKGGAARETDQTLKNIRTVLEAAGASFNNVVKTTVLLTDIGDYGAVNEVYSKYFSKNKPARAAYQVVALPRGAHVEIEAIAVLGNIIDSQ